MGPARTLPMMTRRILVALAAVVVATAASAVVWRHDAAPEAALALAAKHPAVGRVLPDGSATLIARQWAVTAAHVAERIAKDGELEFGSKRYAVRRVHIHPQGHGPAGQPPEVDLALVELATPVAGIEPVAIHRGRDELERVMTIVGCGDFGPARAPRTHQDGRCRAVTNAVADAGPKRLFFVFDAPPAGSPLEGIGVAGDSGGAALVEVGGAWQLAGVSSGGNGPPGAYGTEDIYTRVSTYADWIDRTLQAPGGDASRR